MYRSSKASKYDNILWLNGWHNLNSFCLDIVIRFSSIIYQNVQSIKGIFWLKGWHNSNPFCLGIVIRFFFCYSSICTVHNMNYRLIAYYDWKGDTILTPFVWTRSFDFLPLFIQNVRGIKEHNSILWLKGWHNSNPFCLEKVIRFLPLFIQNVQGIKTIIGYYDWKGDTIITPFVWTW